MKPLYFSLLLAFLSVNVNAQNTYVPDDNFEQALIDKGLDFGVLDDYVPTANISNTTFLSIKNKSISDLTGIEDFAALQTLDVSSNNLTNFDISYNSNLTTLYCNSNGLTSLDVSNNLSLTNLHCFDNNLTVLNLNNNVFLRVLYIYINNLTRLNLSNNPFLESINCSTNELEGINLKNGKNTRITFFLAANNPNLNCIQVDDPVYSKANWIYFDPSMTFSQSCRYSSRYIENPNNLQNEIFTKKLFSIYPNPAENVISISIQTDAKYSIINSIGQTLKQGVLVKGQTTIDVSQLDSGLFFMNVTANNESFTQKIVKR